MVYWRLNLDELSQLHKQGRVVRGDNYEPKEVMQRKQRELEAKRLKQKGYPYKNIDQWLLRRRKKEERRRLHRRKFKK